MTILFYLTAFLFSLGQLGRISFFNQQINFYLYEVVLILNLLVLIFLRYRFQPIKEAWEKNKPIFFFMFILLLSLLIGWQEYNLFNNIVGALYFSRLLLYFLYFFYLKYHSQKIKKGVFLIAILAIISTFIQYFFYPDLRNLFYLGWDPHLYRTFGLFFDTSISAAIFGIFFLSTNQQIVKLIYLLLIALSFSRSTYLGLFITLTYLYVRQKRFKKLILFLLLFVVFVFVIPKPTGEGVNLKRFYSITSRGEDYQQAINLWKKKPLIGYGYNRIRYIKNSDSTHSGASFSSSFLTVLVSSGILGLLSFIWVLWVLRKSNKMAPILLIFLSLVSLSDNILLHPFILFLLFVNLSDK